MQSARSTHRFGPFELDPERRHLTREREPVWLQHRAMDVLLLLVANAGQVVTKRLLTERVWRDVAVTDNTIVQAVRALRQALGRQPSGEPYIDTLVGKGYRFTAMIESAQPAQAGGDPKALLAPFLAFVTGRAALETLDRRGLVAARQAFELAVGLDPRLAEAHVGLANVHFLIFESARADTSPDRAPLKQAEHHAREGCRLSPASGDAWGTLALVRYRSGELPEATAAARKAVTLEPGSALHYLRQAYVSWGAERLRAAQRAQTLCPGVALAHWFAATVFVARGMFDRALEELRAGCEAQDAQTTRFPAVGLHWLRGLVHAATGAEDEALAEFERELALENPGHVYGNEACANAWYAIGALHLRAGHREVAIAAFQEALKRMPRHQLALIGLAGSKSEPALRSKKPALLEPRQDPREFSGSVDEATMTAAGLALQQEHQKAARICGEALMQAESGPAGWVLPVEPLLHVTAHRDAWAPTLALLRARAV